MRRRVLVFVLLVAALLALRGGPRLLALRTPGALPDPAASPPIASAPLTVLTLNVLCSFCTKDGYDGWSERLPVLQAALARHDPDLAALQELARPAELDALLGPRSPYTALYHPLWPDSVLLYRTARFSVLDAGQLWLSPTPTLPLARAWRPGMPRLLQWAHLTDAQGGALLFAATHLDGDRANKDASAALIGQTIPPLAERLPVILAGDLNTAISDDRMAILRGGLQDAEQKAARSEQHGTVEGIPNTRRELRPSLRIDHILISEDIAVQRFVHDAPIYGTPPRRPSDHPVIVAEVSVAPAAR